MVIQISHYYMYNKFPKTQSYWVNGNHCKVCLSLPYSLWKVHVNEFTVQIRTKTNNAHHFPVNCHKQMLFYNTSYLWAHKTVFFRVADVLTNTLYFKIKPTTQNQFCIIPQNDFYLKFWTDRVILLSDKYNLKNIQGNKYSRYPGNLFFIMGTLKGK